MKIIGQSVNWKIVFDMVIGKNNVKRKTMPLKAKTAGKRNSLDYQQAYEREEKSNRKMRKKKYRTFWIFFDEKKLLKL